MPGFSAGERLLVHGGSSGIGTTAIQIASALGVRVFATAGSPEKCAACERLGAERAIDYRSEDFVSVAKELTGGEGVDVVLDMVGGSYVQRNLATLRPEGRLAQIAFLEGSKCQIDLNSLMRKRLSIVGSTLRPQSVESKARIAASLEQNVWPLVESGAGPARHRLPAPARTGGGGSRANGGRAAHRKDPAGAQLPVKISALRLCAPYI